MVSARRKGLVHIYTGNGKGKSTAAFGLAVRAAGSGMNVLILQFIKGKPCGELAALRSVRGITVRQCGRGCFIRGTPKAEDRNCAERALDGLVHDLASCAFDLVILDEALCAVTAGLVPLNRLIGILGSKPSRTELVLTGRNCPTSLYRLADYVTEMREVKHPYRRGIAARRGIEH